MAQGINMFLQHLPKTGLVELTLDYFRLRAMVILGTTLPLMVLVLNIWAFKYSRYHGRIFIGLIAYWTLAVLLSPNENVIMTLCIPPLLMLMVAMMATFIITWKTGRLQEIRSDVLIISFVIGIVGQGLKVPLTNMGLEHVADIMTMLMMVIATIGLVNPWRRREMKKEQIEEPLETENKAPWATRASILALTAVLLTIATVLRMTDILVLGLGDTWINILPSKIIPALLLLGIFWRYRRDEIPSMLGLTTKDHRVHIVMGLVMFAGLYFVVDVGATLIYALFDPSYPIALTIVDPMLFPYMIFFFFVNAVMEETYFRGILQNGLKTKYSANISILISATIFGVWHAVWSLVTGHLMEGMVLVIFSGILGGFFGVYYEYFSEGKSLMGPIVGHWLFNLFNENVKFGPGEAIQGPDLVFGSPWIMPIAIGLFFIIFGFLFYVAYKYRVDDVRNLFHRLVGSRFRAFDGDDKVDEQTSEEDPKEEVPVIRATTYRKGS